MENEGKSKNYIQQAHAIADSLTMNSLNHRLLAVEKKYDVQLAELNKIKYQSRFRGALLALAGVIIASLLLLLGLMRYRNRLKMKQNEAEMLKADLEDSLTNLKKMQRLLGDGEQSDDGKNNHSNKLRAIVNQQIDAVQQLMKLSYQYHGEDFAAKFREAMTLPKTGDESNVALWAAIAGVSLIAVVVIAAVLLNKRKKGKKAPTPPETRSADKTRKPPKE